MPHSKLGVGAGILLLSSVLGCSGGEAASLRGARGAVVDSSAGTVVLGLDDPVAYRATATAGGASLSGTITRRTADTSSATPSTTDSVVAVARDQGICGDTATVTDVPATGGALMNALVWIEGISVGKPLPELRRDRITIHNCQFEPRLVAVPLGTTINIFSVDATEHDARFYREGAGEPVEHVRTFNAGSLVPSEKIAKEPGIVEIRSRLRPYARGYVAVFNHPYYAVTDERGVFTIDGLPEGTYTVKVWHEGLSKPAEQRVTILPDGGGRLDLAIPLD
jgi:hypothetical protein